MYSYVCMYVFIYYAIPVAAQSKTWVYGRSLAEIMGSNPLEQGSATRGPQSPLPWPTGRFEKITTNASPARCLHII
jgi:hypothetical protein